MFSESRWLDLHLVSVLNQEADLVKELSDFNHVSVEVDVPQCPRCLTGVFEPPSNTLI